MSTKTATTGTRASARERLLAAANELFYENGIHSVGIDRVIEHAGVAKASLYDCFGSKDELIRAYLEARSAARRALINERVGRHDDPRNKILSIFDTLGEVVARPGYRGCAFVRASADANSSAKVRSVCSETRAFMLGKFTDLCREAGAGDPQLLGKQLVLLYDGAATSAYMDGNGEAVGTARALAEQLLSGAAVVSRHRPRRS
jgi:AcrR family transcriptional regulator